MDRDRALADLGFPVVGLALGLFVARPGRHGGAGASFDRVRQGGLHDLSVHHRQRLDVEADGVGVVDRDPPPDQAGFLLPRLVPGEVGIGDRSGVRHENLRHAGVHGTVGALRRPGVDGPGRRVLEGQIALTVVAEQIGELLPADALVQERGVERVQRVLLDLQPVALRDPAAADVAVRDQDHVLVVDEAVVLRELGHEVGRTHVGEDETAELPRGVPGLSHPLPAPGPGRLGGLLEAASLDVVQPPVVAAANALGLDLPVLHRRAAMGAVAVDEARPPAAVPEGDEILPQDSHRQGQVRELLRQRHRLPVPPQQLAHRGAELDMCQQRVLLGPLRNPSVA